MAFNGEAATPLPFPIIADDKRVLSVQLGMLDPDEIDKDGMPLTARCVRVLPGPPSSLVPGRCRYPMMTHPFNTLQ